MATFTFGDNERLCNELLALVIETLEVTQRRFCDVDEDFALLEGENEDLYGS